MKNILKSKLIPWLLITIFSSQLFSCGYILFPERRGQKHVENLDWPVVGLDAIGLIFFIIPGVIAFAVDFTSHTIYLPPKFNYLSLDNLKDGAKIKLDHAQFDKKIIATEIEKQTGLVINFNDPRLLVYGKK